MLALSLSQSYRSITRQPIALLSKHYGCHRWQGRRYYFVVRDDSLKTCTSLTASSIKASKVLEDWRRAVSRRKSTALFATSWMVPVLYLLTMPTPLRRTSKIYRRNGSGMAAGSDSSIEVWLSWYSLGFVTTSMKITDVRRSRTATRELLCYSYFVCEKDRVTKKNAIHQYLLSCKILYN